MSKQKSLFDKEQTKVLPKKEQIKTESEFVPFEESIFAKPKKSKVVKDTVQFIVNNIGDYVPIEDTIFCPKKYHNTDKYYNTDIVDKDNEDIKYIIYDDEVPFEESIFAKPKKSKVLKQEISDKDNEKRIKDLFEKYKEIYKREYISYIQKLYSVDADTYNQCCRNLESHKPKLMNIVNYDLSKTIIVNSCTSVEDVFYCYTNLNRALIDFLSELNPDILPNEIFDIIDISYAEVLSEFKLKKW